jgi:hypothetical protein
MVRSNIKGGLRKLHEQDKVSNVREQLRFFSAGADRLKERRKK